MKRGEAAEPQRRVAGKKWLVVRPKVANKETKIPIDEGTKERLADPPTRSHGERLRRDQGVKEVGWRRAEGGMRRSDTGWALLSRKA